MPVLDNINHTALTDRTKTVSTITPTEHSHDLPFKHCSLSSKTANSLKVTHDLFSLTRNS